MPDNVELRSNPVELPASARRARRAGLFPGSWRPMFSRPMFETRHASPNPSMNFFAPMRMLMLVSGFLMPSNREPVIASSSNFYIPGAVFFYELLEGRRVADVDEAEVVFRSARLSGRALRPCL